MTREKESTFLHAKTIEKHELVCDYTCSHRKNLDFGIQRMALPMIFRLF